jgi:hypothetical protein
MRGAGCVLVLTEHEEFTSNCSRRNLRNDILEKTGVDGKIILIWLLKGWGV